MHNAYALDNRGFRPVVACFPCVGVSYAFNVCVIKPTIILIPLLSLLILCLSFGCRFSCETTFSHFLLHICGNGDKTLYPTKLWMLMSHCIVISFVLVRKLVAYVLVRK